MDQTLSSPCPLTGSSRARCQCAHRRGMWRRNLRHFIGALHKKETTRAERTDGTLFNFFYIRGGGRRELILKVYFSEFLQEKKRRVGPDNPLGREEKTETKIFCTVELDHLRRISNMKTCIHPTSVEATPILITLPSVRFVPVDQVWVI